ncbi:peptidase domain-containing ABC transporter [Roseateles sp.]|uniref:peptidase domain-containing ABC transporter n=1 Tax=Roseateles sp. TaxID=1971397 RepID=UPI0031D582AE
MNPFDWLRGRRELPMFHQSEVAECGLASFAMIAAYHGHHVDLNGLRQRYALSLKGATLADLMRIADGMDFAGRPLRLEPSHLNKLQLPCILHWDMNHFVVLKELRGEDAIIHDPALGVRRISPRQMAKSFTGVALELTPTASFQPREVRIRARMRDLWTRVRGWQGPLLQTLVLSVMLQLFTMAAPAFLQLAMDDAVARLDQNFLLVLALAFGAMYILQSLTEALRGWTVLQLGQAMSFQLSGNVLRHLLRLPAEFFEKRIVGDILSRMGAVKPIQEALTQSAVTALIDGVMMIATAVLLMIYSPALGGIVLVSLVLYAVFVLGLYPLRRRREEEQLIAQAEAQTYLIESIRASKTVKLYGRESQREVVWRNHFGQVVNAALGTGQVEVGTQFARSLIFNLQLVLVVYFGSLMVMESSLSAGMLFAILLYRNQFGDRAEALLRQVVQFRLLRLHMERLADIVTTPREAGLESAAALPERTPRGALSLREVSFRYAQNEPLLLQSISLDIQPGEYVAIVGSSGGGKTTLLKLMLSLLPPTSGEILVDGMPLQSFGIRAWRQAIGVVQQDDGLLMGTIADNIAFFDPQVDMARVVESAQAAAVHDEIQAMPMGYLSMVGDMGSTLSGGQRQRVLLARALYRKPAVLFLDEGTANLDPGAERRIADLVQDMPITRIVVAHRPELVDRADRVLELVQGRLVERRRAPDRAPGEPELIDAEAAAVAAARAPATTDASDASVASVASGQERRP